MHSCRALATWRNTGVASGVRFHLADDIGVKFCR